MTKLEELNYLMDEVEKKIERMYQLYFEIYGKYHEKDPKKAKDERTFDC